MVAAAVGQLAGPRWNGARQIQLGSRLLAGDRRVAVDELIAVRIAASRERQTDGIPGKFGSNLW